MANNNADNYELCPAVGAKLQILVTDGLDAFYVPIGFVLTVLIQVCQGLNLKTRVVKMLKSFMIC